MVLSAKKRRIFCLVLVFCVAGLLGGLIYYVSGRTLSKKRLHLATDVSLSLRVNTKLPVRWYSTDTDTVFVDKHGKVTGISAGSAKVYAKVLWRKLTCSVTVEDPVLSQESLDMVIGETALVSVEGTTFSVQCYSESDKISYDEGTVTALYDGEDCLYFSAGGKELVCQVHVRQPSVPKSVSVEKGKETALDVKDWPKGVSPVWKSSNGQIAEAVTGEDGTVLVKGNNAGTADLETTIGDYVYKVHVSVHGDQQMSIEGGDVMVGEKCELSIRNFVPGYKVTWTNARPTEDGKAVVESDVRGSVDVTATVDTGVEKKVLTKEVVIRHKTLNTTSWSGHSGETFDLEMQDAVHPQYQYDTSVLSRNGTTFTALSAGTTEIMVMDGGTILTCSVTVTAGGEVVASKAAEIADGMVSHGFIYANSSCSHSWDGALSDANYRANCAIYASWALQEAGYLSSGKILYYSHGLKGSGVDEVESNPKLSVTYPEKDPEDCNLEPGDVCGFQLNSSSGHMAVFAGRDADGNLLWYTGGRDATDTGKKGGTFSNLGPRKQSYYHSVDCLIRVK